MAMTPYERAMISTRLRWKAIVMANHAADEAGPLSALDRAEFILRRLYPEFTDEQISHIRSELARAEAAGTWHGFRRPAS
ncbi:MAG: hypothetical protein ACRDHD_10460 [Candidatus Limnocylindria bacterium]